MDKKEKQLLHLTQMIVEHYWQKDLKPLLDDLAALELALDDARAKYDLKPGDAMIVLGDEKGIALLKTEIFQSAIDQAMGGLTQ